MKAKQSKVQWVKNYLSRGWYLTAIKAYEECKIIRLSDTICELRKKGWDIESILVRNDDNTTYAKYRLRKKPDTK